MPVELAGSGEDESRLESQYTETPCLPARSGFPPTSSTAVRAAFRRRPVADWGWDPLAERRGALASVALPV